MTVPYLRSIERAGDRTEILSNSHSAQEAAMSAISAIEVAELDEVIAAGGRPAARGSAAARTARTAVPRAHLQLVAPVEPRSAGRERHAAAAAAMPALIRPTPARPAPLRLTRRGRIVFGFVGVVLATVALTVVSMSLSGAQAANHGRAGAGYQGMRQIVVQPGQTLWSIAARAEPSADPRQVIAEIMSANSLTGSSLQAGELLWVPR
jgi:hypothetical protein